MTTEPIACTPKYLPGDQLIAAAQVARDENPTNHPPVAQMALLSPETVPNRLEIAVVTSKYWRGGGVVLPVGFLDTPPSDLKAKIISHMNAWGRTANVSFSESTVEPKVRITRGNTGHWSYIGTDILLIDRAAPTMNLQGFTMQTPDSEFYRVVRHETGHTLGCPHEHMRQELVALIDPAKAIAYYGQTQGWSPDQVRQQVLTPLEQGSIWGTDRPDMQSIMCYQIPGGLTYSGQPILGGIDIDPSDYAFMGKVYPKPPRAPVTASAIGDAPAAAHACPDCIAIDLPNGVHVGVPAEATSEQLQMVLAAVKG